MMIPAPVWDAPYLVLVVDTDPELPPFLIHCADEEMRDRSLVRGARLLEPDEVPPVRTEPELVPVLLAAAAPPPEYVWKDGPLPGLERRRRGRGLAPNEADYANGHARVNDAWIAALLAGADA